MENKVSRLLTRSLYDAAHSPTRARSGLTLAMGG